MANSGTGNSAITAALAVMAARRQATGVDQETLDLFSADLSTTDFEVGVIVEACDNIGWDERKEGEPSFPSLGAIVRACSEVERERRWFKIQELAAKAPPPRAEPLEPTKAEAKVIVKKFEDRVKAILKAQRSNG